MVTDLSARLAALAALALAVAPARAQERTMSWPEIQVEARLDAAGDLHIRERQVILFDGAWNGGERTFRVGRGQRLRFERIVREGVDGRLVELTRGDLGQVDHYAFTDARTLRWRSRAANAPPFAAKRLVYVLEYALSGVLVRQGDEGHLLNHDFAFPDRAWPIGRVRVSLEVDPAWRATGPEPLRFESGPLVPGNGFVVALPLRWTGPGAGPSLASDGLPRVHRLALAVLLVGLLASAAAALVRHARARGQLAPLVDPARIDHAFLREHVLSRPPEVVGAAWDDAVGPPEVAAVLARLASEGKIESRVVRAGGRGIFGRDVLHLTLREPRSSFAGHERSLLDALFVAGDAIDSDRLKAHYSSEGFDPAERIRDGLKRAVEALAPKGPPVPRRAWLLPLAFLAGGVVLGALGGDDPPVGASVAAVLVGLITVTILAAALRRRVAGFVTLGLVLAGVLVGWADLVLWLSGGGLGADAGWVWAHASFWAAGVALALALGRTPLGAEEMALRKRLAAARAHLARELRAERPRLDDAWMPYLLAFGLGPKVDRWFRAHGAAGMTMAASSIGHGGSGDSPGGARWTGGGGAFSGGGATGTWAAFGAIASSIPSPSSSSSGSSGGSSSGGGGGGGW